MAQTARARDGEMVGGERAVQRSGFGTLLRTALRTVLRAGLGCREAGVVLGLGVFAYVAYAQIFVYESFGPEFPLFFFYNHHLTFSQMLKAYVDFKQMWYRPTSFALFYWIGDQLFSWHDLGAWRAFHLLTVIAVAYTVCRLAYELFPERRTVGVVAALYFLAHPGLYMFVYEVAPFDFPYIGSISLCTVFYLRGFRRPDWVGTTVAAWLFFLIALTAKEASLAVPGYLGAVSAILVWAELRPKREGVRSLVRRECLRLAPFLVMLPIYYFVHLRHVTENFRAAGGAYRSFADANAILENLRTLPLWTLRLYFFTGKTLQQTMYHSNLLNNAIGVAMLAAVVWQWRRKMQAEPRLRPLAALLVAWMGMFLLMPIYGGGFQWHTNLAVVAYAILFARAAVWYLDDLRDAIRARWAKGALVLGMLALTWSNLSVELHNGSHTIGFQMVEKLLKSPPVAPEKLPRAPVVAIEDRLGLGPWWYGCYGRLFNYVYQRHDIEEILISPQGPIPEKLLPGHTNPASVFLFRYDDRFQWHDVSELLRNPITVTPEVSEVRPGEQLRFRAQLRLGPVSGVSWSIAPQGAGRISNSGVFLSPGSVSSPRTVRVTASSKANPKLFSTASVLVAYPWEGKDIGRPPAVGSDGVDGAWHTVTGSGRIGGWLDAFRYVHQRMDGDGVVVARVEIPKGRELKAGIMLRESAAPDSAFALSCFNGAGAPNFAYRRPGGEAMVEGSRTGDVAGGAGAAATAATEGVASGSGDAGGKTVQGWVALARSGDLFTAFRSRDGAQWIPVGKPQQIPMGQRVLAGFAVGTEDGEAVTVRFGPVRFENAGLGTADRQAAQGVPGPLRPQFTPIRVNAGGASHRDASGVTWHADVSASGGSTAAVAIPIRNTRDAALYTTERWDAKPFDYAFSVPSGRYRVTLKFAEIYFTEPGRRIFDVRINGEPVLRHFDTVREAGGPYRAIDRQFLVVVQDDELVIEFVPVVSNAKISAFEIVRERDDPVRSGIAGSR